MNLTALQSALACAPIAYVSHGDDGTVVIAVDGLDPVRRACAESIVRDGATEPHVAATKWYAAYRIEVMAGMTPHAQVNWTQSLLFLADILLDGGTLTAEQTLDRAYGRAALRWKDATRLASDEIERLGISPFSDEAASIWPGFPDPSTVRPVPKYV